MGCYSGSFSTNRDTSTPRRQSAEINYDFSREKGDDNGRRGGRNYSAT